MILPWTRQSIERTRGPGWDSRVETRESWRERWKPKLVHVVVAWVPGPEEYGIIVAGRNVDGNRLLLDDLSRYVATADELARVVKGACDAWGAREVRHTSQAHHIGVFPELEDLMCTSPVRLRAYVLALEQLAVARDRSAPDQTA